MANMKNRTRIQSQMHRYANVMLHMGDSQKYFADKYYDLAIDSLKDVMLIAQRLICDMPRCRKKETCLSKGETP